MTRFECRGLPALLLLLALHVRVKHAVRRHASRGFLGARTIVDWRHRTLLSISLWQDLDSVYSMGSVHAHVLAARIPDRLGVATTGGVFCFAGDWRRVMFGSDCPPRSPLHPLTPSSHEGVRHADTN